MASKQANKLQVSSWKLPVAICNQPSATTPGAKWPNEAKGIYPRSIVTRVNHTAATSAQTNFVACLLFQSATNKVSRSPSRRLSFKSLEAIKYWGLAMGGQAGPLVSLFELFGPTLAEIACRW